MARPTPCRRVRAALLLLLILLAGCASEPPAGAPILRATDEDDAFVLRGTLDVGVIAAGETAAATFLLENHGADATYETGGCGSLPWAYDILADDGTRVGPLTPDPRCLGPPLTRATLARDASLQSELRWDGYVKERDANGEVLREPAAPGAYTLRATLTMTRGERESAPTVELRVVVRST